jgi:di/tricarboxylate transporter
VGAVHAAAGLLCLLLMPLAIYSLSPPELKATPNAVEYARAEMAGMGPAVRQERVMLGTFGVMLLLWANVPAMLFGPAAGPDRGGFPRFVRPDHGHHRLG